MYVVACSWRVRMKRMSFSSRSAAMAPYSCTPGSPNTTRTPSRCSSLASASPPFIFAMTSVLLIVRVEYRRFERRLCRRHPPGGGRQTRARLMACEGRRKGGEAPLRGLAVLAELEAADLAAVHLVGAVGEAQ